MEKSQDNGNNKTIKSKENGTDNEFLTQKIEALAEENES